MIETPATARDAQTPKRKIVILGGGCGGLSAAWGLVNSEQAADLDITVYQLGWRLGGKGASGRNAAIHDRIEEHGLHIWGGMYENAFAIMRSVYGQLKRPSGTPLSVWYDPARPDDCAFLPEHNATLGEFYNGAWIPWNIDVPGDSGLPGDGRELPTLREYLELVLDLLEEMLFGQHPRWQRQHAPPPPGALPSTGKRVWHALGDMASEMGRRIARTAFRFLARHHLKRARRALKAMPADARSHTSAHHDAVLGALEALRGSFEKFFAHWLDDHPGVRRVYMIADLGTAIVRGVLHDGILVHGLDVVDGVEFRKWLQTHGASDVTLHGALVRGWHDFFFAYKNGDGTRPSLSAASGLRTLFRYCFTYRGAFFWKMQAGMGDTIFTPLYQALKEKGVTFRFFHRIEDLGLSDDGTPTAAVQVIRITRQVDLAPGVTEYVPVRNVLGVDSWPSEPLYAQLDPAQAKRLQDGGVNLESWWANWPGVETFTLEKGRDFDDVILAIPPSASRHLTTELADRSERWRAMLDNIASNQTIAAQVWLTKTIGEMGWPYGSTVGTVYSNPHNTWANMDQLLKRETWGDAPGAPKSVVYFCGTITDAVPTPPFDDHAFPTAQNERIKEVSLTWLDSNLGPLYPTACQPGTPQLEWHLLVPQSATKGESRFDTQYWHINIDPSERYVLSLPNTAQYRPRAHESGFTNLYLAGDWLRTGINAGCVEAAVMGGLQASQAITGFPKVIVGDDL